MTVIICPKPRRRTENPLPLKAVRKLSVTSSTVLCCELVQSKLACSALIMGDKKMEITYKSFNRKVCQKKVKH